MSRSALSQSVYSVRRYPMDQGTLSIQAFLHLPLTEFLRTAHHKNLALRIPRDCLDLRTAWRFETESPSAPAGSTGALPATTPLQERRSAARKRKRSEERTVGQERRGPSRA